MWNYILQVLNYINWQKYILKNQLVIHSLMVSWRVYKTTQTTGDHSPVSDQDW